MKGRLLLLPLAVLSLGFGWPGADPEPVGEAGVRMLWFGEHVGLLTANLEAAGWTPEEMTLQVWGDTGEALPGMPTLLPPSSWAEVGNVQERTIRLDMWANLPDVTWSIADWSMGNERCPWSALGHDVTAASCNTFFLGWLSAANSTHFPPQSHASWSWHHQLALDVAARCVTLDQGLDGLGYIAGPYADWLDGFREECEALAIAFEGVGHHYLQDAWSSGHMWERWGSPDVGDWQDTSIATAEILSPLYAGVLVGGLAGLVHGSESILGDPDPMCSEHPDVYYVPGDGVGIEGGPALGDYNVNGLIDAQRSRLVACGQGSLDEVLAVLPGALGLTPTGAAPVTQEACFDQRVTNRAWQVGLMEAYGYLNYGISTTISWLGRLALLSDGIGDPLGTYAELSTGVQMRSEMARIGIIADAAEWAPQIDPLGTDFANGELPMVDGTVEPVTFLGMTRNREWVSALQTDFASFDPPAAAIAGDVDGANPKKRQDADALRRTFHRAYADYWCPRIDPDKDDEQSDLRRLQSTCQSPDDGFGGKEAACTACEELALRFHRDGEDEGDYDTSAEPLCSAFGATDYFYLPTGGDVGRFSGVGGWCRGGGGWSVSDEFVWTFDPSRPEAAFGDGANIVASLPSGVSALSLSTTPDKAFFSGSDGNLYQVGSFGDLTAFSDPGCLGPRGLAVDAEEGRLYVACHDSHSVASFTLFDSPPSLVDVLDLQGGIPGTIVEEPRDVAVHPFGYEIAVASYET